MTLNELPDYFRGIASWFVDMVDFLYSGNIGELTIGQATFIAVYILIFVWTMYDYQTTGDPLSGMIWGAGCAITGLTPLLYFGIFS